MSTKIQELIDTYGKDKVKQAIEKMDMPKFKIGDRVKVKKYHVNKSIYDLSGKIGYIHSMLVDPSGVWIKIPGLENHTRDDGCWWLRYTNIELADPEPIDGLIPSNIQSEIYYWLSKSTASLMDGYVQKYAVYGLESGDNMKIKKVIFNDPATIIIWNDGSKTIVKCMEGEEYDAEKGLAMALCKKYLGDDFRKTFKKYLKEYEEKEPDHPYYVPRECKYCKYRAAPTNSLYCESCYFTKTHPNFTPRNDE